VFLHSVAVTTSWGGRTHDGTDNNDADLDLRDVALVLSRMIADTGRRTSLDDVIAAFGHTRESLAVIDD
jgi:hypothetical protein